VKLTVLVLTCRRLGYLTRTLAAARQHFSAFEPDVELTWVGLDNGSSDEDRKALLALGFDRLTLSRENLGQGPALNQLLAAVRTDYFLLLEDDWVLESKGAFVGEAIAILEADQAIGQVKLDSLHNLDFTDRALYAGPFLAARGSVPYYVQNPRSPWGGFCCPPAITRTSAVREVGGLLEDQPFRKWWAESEYSARFARRFHVAKSPAMLLFRHIGDEESPGWQDAVGGS
jgi:glycosyltransferase involved in cell wall biosynthesis